MVRGAKPEDLPAVLAILKEHNLEAAKFPFREGWHLFWLVYANKFGAIKGCVQFSMSMPCAWVDNLAVRRGLEGMSYGGRLWVAVCRHLRRAGARGIVGYCKDDHPYMIEHARKEGFTALDGKFHIYVRVV